MTPSFDTFILLAEMRTGSNFLEETLNRIPGLRCWGEAFNPHFVGHAGATGMAGIDMAARDRDPVVLLRAMRERTDGLAGFRFFHDHDARVLERCLPDPRCAKIVLTRNPLDSYVSLQIARATDQWRLGDMRSARSARIQFDPAAFRTRLETLQEFRLGVSGALQRSGQTAFHIAYEDLGEVEVLNGLAAWLGVDGRIDSVARKTKVQNPGELRDKVSNYDEMAESLCGFDHFGLGRIPGFEPRRGPRVPSYVAAAAAPLLFMPVPGGPSAAVEDWLARLDGVSPAALIRGGSQNDVRTWQRRHAGHRRFTMLRHPVARLHHVFCRHVLSPGMECVDGIRATLRRHYDVPIPEDGPGPGYDAAAHRAAFLEFARFVAGSLGGQTSLGVDPLWASQAALVQGMAGFMPPDMVLREGEASARLAELAATVGWRAPDYAPDPDPAPVPLARIYDATVEAAVRRAYRRDYKMFGFDDWA